MICRTILILFVTILTSSGRVLASENSSPPKAFLGYRSCFAGDDWDVTHLRKRMLLDATTTTSDLPSWKSTTISVELTRGRIDKPQINEGSGDAQLDFDCLQAVLGINRGTHTISGPLSETFSRSEFAHFVNEQKKEETRKYLAFRVIPVAVSDRFKHLISDDEIFGSNNLGFIPNNSRSKVSKQAVETLRHIYCDEWAPIINEGAKPSPEEIIHKRDQILKELSGERTNKSSL